MGGPSCEIRNIEKWSGRDTAATMERHLEPERAKKDDRRQVPAECGRVEAKDASLRNLLRHTAEFNCAIDHGLWSKVRSSDEHFRFSVSGQPADIVPDALTVWILDDGKTRDHDRYFVRRH